MKNCSWTPLLSISMLYTYTFIEFTSVYIMENNTFCCGDRMKSLPTLAAVAAVSAEQEVEFYGAHG